MDPQKIFDTVVQHLAKQGKRSYNDNIIGCAYRAPGGLSCAVGCLIPDDLYDPKMDREATDYGSLIESFPEIEEYFGTDNNQLLIDLQGIHDVSQARDSLITEISLVAKEHGLNRAVVDTVEFPEYWR